MRFFISMATALLIAGTCFATPPSAEVKTKVDKMIAAMSNLSTDATVVSEVKAYNAAPTKDMTQEKWKELTILSPEVRALTKNKLAVYLKTKQTPEVDEIFVSGSDGTKVAFLAKTTNRSHAGKPKHDQAMKGKTWIGDVEMDESTGKQSIQFSIPVLDGSKVIGSIVIGLSVSALK